MADASPWRDWIGRTERRVDRVAAAPLAALSATLDRDDPEPHDGDPVPPLWHWLLFTPVTPQHGIGPDGHARRGEFLPPVPLPRRMWAGGRLTFERPIAVGDDVERMSRITDVAVKQGRSGSLVFVTVHHEIADALGVAIREEHDIVYRDATPRAEATAAPTPAPTNDEYTREIAPDPVLLFRYSALTFNGHRIHYDRDYATGVEGYPGLVVHGPLIATLLLDLMRRQHPHAVVRHFRFKALHPLFDLHRFALCGRAEGARTHALWARDHQGALAMHASAELA
ncbi:MAG: MaoC family dehydratase N-terminal domain-containing protein [Betaproteobacteria bacterium]